jgi:outer membrane protein OmpA-like peptidoglycan-associated protein
MFTKSLATSLTIVSLLASIAMAQESQTSSMGAPRPSSMNVNDPVGWFPFLGLSGGYMSPNDTLMTEGTPGDLKIIGSYFNESRRSVFDVGLGFMGDTFTQKVEGRDSFITGGVAELAWRYNSTNRWQVGPVLNTLIGSNGRYGSTDPNLTTFGGLQIVKEIPVRGSNMFRIGLKGMGDLSIPDQDISTVMLDLQWGFGKEQKAPEVAAVDESTRMPAETNPDTKETFASGTDESQRSDVPRTVTDAGTEAGATYGLNARRVIETDPSNNALILRNDARMQFDTGSTTLTGVNSSFVEKLGSSLANRADLFDRVEVIGYADQTGSRQINNAVSRNRANSVVKQLQAGGLDRSKIQSSWKGSSEILYQSMLPEDMQQNRRVDLKFHGVKDQAALEQLLQSL